MKVSSPPLLPSLLLLSPLPSPHLPLSLIIARLSHIQDTYHEDLKMEKEQTVDTKRILKTQNLNYLSYKRQIDLKVPHPPPNLPLTPLHLTTSPSHPLTLSPSHPLTLSPSHPLTLSPSHFTPHSIPLALLTSKQKIDKLQASLHFLDAPPQNKRTIFVDNDDEIDKFDPVSYYNTVPEGLDRHYNIPTKESLENAPIFLNEDNVSILNCFSLYYSLPSLLLYLNQLVILTCTR